jgi:hypothetical protein
MIYKNTTKLFKGAYQYKIVLVCAGASWFRSGDMNEALTQLKKVDLEVSQKTIPTWRTTSYIKTQEDLDYALGLQSELSKMKGIDVRVESPWVSIYANSKKEIDTIIKLNPLNVKYVCVPPSNITLNAGCVILPKVKYDYRVTLGKTTQEHSAFVGWAESNKNLKLTKSCKKDLLKDRTWGGKYFYLTGDNNLLMAKMHLGGSIAKVERIVNN